MISCHKYALISSDSFAEFLARRIGIMPLPSKFPKYARAFRHPLFRYLMKQFKEVKTGSVVVVIVVDVILSRMTCQRIIKAISAFCVKSDLKAVRAMSPGVIEFQGQLVNNDRRNKIIVEFE